MSVRSGWSTAVCEVRFDPHFEGEYNPDVAVQCYGLFGSLLSFENVASQLMLQLSQRFDAVAAHDYRFPDGRNPELFRDRAYLTPDAPVGVFHGIAYEELPDAMAGHGFRVGCLVCDADVVPASEIEICHDSFDLVVVPSTFCRRVYRASGLRLPVLVAPHGISPAFVPVEDRRAGLFTFYNVFDQARDYRKSGEELIRSFVKAFDRDPDIRLRLRTTLSPRLTACLDNANAWDVVTVDQYPLGEPEYARSFSGVHATVHPSKAEGFGMIPLQSLACGTPVIAPCTTGLSDYLTSNNAMLLRTSGTVPAQGDSAYSAGGTYHAVDEDHLVCCLQAMRDNWREEEARARAAAADIRRRYSWPRVLEPLLEVIARELDRPGSSAVDGAASRVECA